ncbi:MAG: hypothetical protein SGI90_13880 [Candidatus Eisenbacteria bacterium]|nr:hypothetical protein [Candidatus Eisenbacteria bacterium]
MTSHLRRLLSAVFLLIAFACDDDEDDDKISDSAIMLRGAVTVLASGQPISGASLFHKRSASESFERIGFSGAGGDYSVQIFGATAPFGLMYASAQDLRSDTLNIATSSTSDTLPGVYRLTFALRSN